MTCKPHEICIAQEESRGFIVYLSYTDQYTYTVQQHLIKTSRSKDISQSGVRFGSDMCIKIWREVHIRTSLSPWIMLFLYVCIFGEIVWNAEAREGKNCSILVSIRNNHCISRFVIFICGQLLAPYVKMSDIRQRLRTRLLRIHYKYDRHMTPDMKIGWSSLFSHLSLSNRQRRHAKTNI